MNEINKPVSMNIKETKTKLINACNESGLPPIILDLILQGICSEIHYLAEKQYLNDESSYMEELKNNKLEDTEIA